jgi:hypothetical protein
MTNFPQGPFRRGLRTTIQNNTPHSVVVQLLDDRTEPDPPFVMIETPDSEERGDIKEPSTGYDLTQTIRIHTRFPKGKADLSQREEIAEDVHNAIDANFDPVGHNILYIPEPDITFQSYEAGGQQAYDMLLDYELLTQTI